MTRALIDASDAASSPCDLAQSEGRSNGYPADRVAADTLLHPDKTKCTRMFGYVSSFEMVGLKWVIYKMTQRAVVYAYICMHVLSNLVRYLIKISTKMDKDIAKANCKLIKTHANQHYTAI